MKRAYFVAALGALVGTSLGLASCSEDNGTTNPSVKTDSGVTTDSTSPTDSGPGTDSGGGTDGGGSDGTAPKCPTAPKTGSIESLRDPASSTKAIINDGVKLSGVVATSIKFRTSGTPKAAGDTCSFGVFVADANATFKPWSGILVLSYGPDAVASDSGGFTCKTDGDFIPADTKPGDKFDLTGTYTEFGPTATTCGKATPPLPPPSPDKMPEVFKVCEMTKTGTGTVPTPADVTPAQIETKAADAGSAIDEVKKWAGGLVRISNAEADTCTGTCTGALSFGAFKVKGSTLLVGDDIYYRGSATAPTVAVGDKLNVTGLVYLDFCTWTLQPSQCKDMTWVSGTGKCPASGGTDGGTDTGSDTGSSDTGSSDSATDASASG